MPKKNRVVLCLGHVHPMHSGHSIPFEPATAADVIESRISSDVLTEWRRLPRSFSLDALGNADSIELRAWLRKVLKDFRTKDGRPLFEPGNSDSRDCCFDPRGNWYKCESILAMIARDPDRRKSDSSDGADGYEPWTIPDIDGQPIPLAFRVHWRFAFAPVV